MIQIFEKNKAFTLVEIMIVIAVVALLASITVPNLQRAKRQAEEALVSKTMRSISDSMEMYQATTGDYPDDLTSLTGAVPPYFSSEQVLPTGVYSSAHCGTEYYKVPGTDYSFMCAFDACASSAGSFECRGVPFARQFKPFSFWTNKDYSKYFVRQGGDFFKRPAYP